MVIEKNLNVNWLKNQTGEFWRKFALLLTFNLCYCTLILAFRDKKDNTILDITDFPLIFSLIEIGICILQDQILTNLKRINTISFKWSRTPISGMYLRMF